MPQLKDLIKEAVKENEAGGQHQVSYSPRTTSLSVSRAQTQRDAAEERFFRALDAEVIPCPPPAPVCTPATVSLPGRHRRVIMQHERCTQSESISLPISGLCHAGSGVDLTWLLRGASAAH